MLETSVNTPCTVLGFVPSPLPAGAPPSNTAPANYRSGPYRLLRLGVDSLYLSFFGVISADMDATLADLKLKGQNILPIIRSQAQIRLGDHLFEVKGWGRKRFSYVIVDNWFNIQIAGPDSKSLPLAYVQISSEFLSAHSVLEAVAILSPLIAQLGAVRGEARVSRVDLFADFIAYWDVQALEPEAWITYAKVKRKYHENNRASSWDFGMGGMVSARLYDKTLEIGKSQKDYLKGLWAAAGWKDETVWRLEFELKRQVLKEMSVSSVPELVQNLPGLWKYGTEKWLRLALPDPRDSNQSRWPTHPVWSALAGVSWEGYESPLLTRARKERVPSDEYLFKAGLAPLTSFMVREGIADIYEASRLFLAKATRYHFEQSGFRLDGFDNYIDVKVAEKCRKFNLVMEPRNV